MDNDQEHLLFCKDCKHYRRDYVATIFCMDNIDRCRRDRETALVNIDLVTGVQSKTKVKDRFASTERKYNDGNSCGTHGKFWSPRRKTDLFKLFHKKYS